MDFRAKVLTAVRVCRTFGPFELVRLASRKISAPKSGSGEVFKPQDVQIKKASEFTNQFLGSLLKVSATEINLARSEYVAYENRFNQKAKKARTSFFNPIYDLGPGMSEFIFLCIVTKKPQFVIETGVAAGVSTDSILSAMQLNKSGCLVSLDITEKVGELIDDELKARWRLEILPELAREKSFVEILNSNPQASIFLHDSDHSASWQIKEFSHVVQHLPGIELILFDDISQELINLIIADYANYQILVIDENRKYSAIITKS
jgi:predicted O-methyltransferase YrrM